MITQVIIRLTLYIDQAIIRNGQELADGSIFGIQNTVNINCTTLFGFEHKPDGPGEFIDLFYSPMHLSHFCAKDHIFYWNMHELPCSCGCLLKAYICTMLSL